jgi:hypothetical protein
MDSDGYISLFSLYTWVKWGHIFFPPSRFFFFYFLPAVLRLEIWSDETAGEYGSPYIYTLYFTLQGALPPLPLSLLKKLNNKKSERAARFLLLAKSFDRGQSIVKVLIDSKPNRFPIACGIQLNQKLEGKKNTQFECCCCCGSLKKNNPSTFFFLLCGRWHELALPFF